MRLTRESLLAIFVKGFLFLVPIGLVVLLVREIVKLLASASQPVSKMVGMESVVGLALADIIAIVGLALACFLAGLLAGTKIGSMIAQKLEYFVLRRIPGFTLAKSMMHGAVGDRTASDVTVALVWIEESWVLGFIMERHDNGLSTVFVPSAPTPAAGTVYYLPDDRLKPLDVPVQTAIACITRLGIGSRELLAGAWETKSGAVAHAQSQVVERLGR